jgi:hypothetical protein
MSKSNTLFKEGEGGRRCRRLLPDEILKLHSTKASSAGSIIQSKSRKMHLQENCARAAIEFWKSHIQDLL